MPTPDPWPGESLPLYDGAVTSPVEDFSLLSYVFYRDSGGRTIASGDVWRLWHSPYWGDDTRYLDDAGASVAASWVVEVLSGSGTLVAAEGFDPDYGEPTAAAPTALGTFTVTGPGPVVIPSTLMDAAQIIGGDDSTMLRLECTSGSIDVQQVKVRAWPTGGALGGWSDVQPGFTSGTGSLPSVLTDTASAAGTDDDGSPSTAWDGAVAAVVPATPDGIFIDLGFTVATSQADAAAFVLALGGAMWRASVSRSETVVIFVGADWTTGDPIDTTTLTEGVDYVRPPTEIAGEAPAYMAQQVGAGGVDWLGATGSATVYAQGDLTDLVPVLHSQAVDTLTLTPAGAGLVTVTGATYTPGTPVATPHPSTDQTVPVTLTTGSGRFLVVSMGYLGAWPAWPGWAPFVTGSSIGKSTLFTATFADLLSRRALPPYRVWDPAGAPAPIPLQWNQRVDDLGREGGITWRSEQASSDGAQWRPRL